MLRVRCCVCVCLCAVLRCDSWSVRVSIAFPSHSKLRSASVRTPYWLQRYWNPRRRPRCVATFVPCSLAILRCIVLNVLRVSTPSLSCSLVSLCLSIFSACAEAIAAAESRRAAGGAPAEGAGVLAQPRCAVGALCTNCENETVNYVVARYNRRRVRRTRVAPACDGCAPRRRRRVSRRCTTVCRTRL